MLPTINYKLIYSYIRNLSISYYRKEPERELTQRIYFVLLFVWVSSGSAELNSDQLLDCKMLVGFKSIPYISTFWDHDYLG